MVLVGLLVLGLIGDCSVELLLTISRKVHCKTNSTFVRSPTTTTQNVQIFSNMNALFLALLSLFAVASSVKCEKFVPWSNNAEWSRSITMQIKTEEQESSPQLKEESAVCSEMALSALKTEVGEWLRDELIDLFGEDAFTLSRVTGVEEGNTISLVASVECIKCSHVVDKDSIAYILLFFMQRMMDEWIVENSNNADVLAGCMGEDTHVSDVLVREKKAVSSVL